MKTDTAASRNHPLAYFSNLMGAKDMQVALTAALSNRL